MSPARPDEPFRIRTAKQLRTLNSPGRMAVVDALIEESPRSAAEIAARVECGVSAAHYHLQKLIELGLVVVAGTRDTGARPERLFGLAARDFVLDPDRMTLSFRREMIRGFRIFLRHAERDLSAAVEEDAAGHRAAKRLRLTRDTARLSDEDLVELAQRLLDIDRFLRERDDPANPNRIGLTMALAPVVR